MGFVTEQVGQVGIEARRKSFGLTLHCNGACSVDDVEVSYAHLDDLIQALGNLRRNSRVLDWKKPAEAAEE